MTRRKRRWWTGTEFQAYAEAVARALMPFTALGVFVYQRGIRNEPLDAVSGGLIAGMLGLTALMRAAKREDNPDDVGSDNSNLGDRRRDRVRDVDQQASQGGDDNGRPSLRARHRRRHLVLHT